MTKGRAEQKMNQNSWEFAGKNVEEAIDAGLSELGLEREDVHVQILEEPQKGFFGIGGKEARVRLDLIGEWEIVTRKTQPTETDEKDPEPEEEGQDEEIQEEKPEALAPTTGEEDAKPGLTREPEAMASEIIRLMEMDVRIVTRETEGYLEVDIEGEDAALLIGRNGTTLEALQFLINIGCRRFSEGAGSRVTVDVEGYRKRRKTRLEIQAEELAESVLKDGRSMEMPPMNATERRMVHMKLRDYRGVQTESIGEEPDRRVVIFPDPDHT